MDPSYLPWGTLVLALFTFGIWLYLKQVEIVHKPPGPNMLLIVGILFFLLIAGFIAPLIIGTIDIVAIVLGWVGIFGSLVMLLVGTARLLQGGKK
jgi:hypothetical protein